MRDLVLLFAWLAMLPIALIRPYIGALLWAWSAFIAPNYYIFGFLSNVPFNKVVGGVTILATLFSRERRNIHLDATLIIILLILAEGGLSCLLNTDNTEQWDVYEKVWKICIFCLFVNMLITTRLRLHSLICISVIALGFHGMLEGLKFLKSAGGHHAEGIPTLGDNNFLAVAFLMIIPLLFYLYRYSANFIVRYTWLGVMLLCCLGVVATFSRGGFIGLAAMAATYLLTTKYKVRSLLLIGVVGAGLLALAPTIWFDRISTIETAQQEESFQTRLISWNISYKLAIDHPFFGAGFNAILDPVIWNRYASKIQVGPAYRDFITRPHAAHSAYFETLGDLGFIGVALYLLLLLVAFRNVGVAIRYAKRQPDLRWIQDLGQMFRLSLVGFAIAGAAVSVAYLEFYFILVSMIAILTRFCRELYLASQVEAETEAMRAIARPERGAPPLAARAAVREVYP